MNYTARAAPCTGSTMRTGLNGKTWPVVVAVGGLAFAGALWALNRPAVSFGSPPHGELLQKVLRRGDRVDVLLGSVYWYRVWPATITQWYECMVREPNGSLFKLRFDLQPRIVPIPSGPGPLPRKTRPVANQQEVPYLVPDICEPGPFQYRGYIRVHTMWGWWPLDYDLPDTMKAEIQP